MTMAVNVLVCRQKERKLSRQEWRSMVEKMIESIVGARVVLSFDEPGKPYVNYPNVAISYSHTEDTLVLAYAAQGGVKLGIDMENRSRHGDISEVQDIAFSKDELALARVDPVTSWCLKEAVMKMHGRGFYDYNPNEITIIRNGQSFDVRIPDNGVIKGFFNVINEGQYTIAICANKEFSLDVRNWNELNGTGLRNEA